VENENSTPEFDPFEKPSAPPRRAGVALGGLALLVALAVAGWNGWLWWQDRSATSEAADLSGVLARLQDDQAGLLQDQAEQSRRLATLERLGLDEGLDRLDQAIEEARSVAGSDRARLASLEEALAGIGDRLDGVESRLAALVVRGESPRQGLELAEVDYLLRSANERLRLYGDQRTADRALELADEQLAAMDDPVYLSVRQAIAAARGALEDVQRPDPIALTETLGRLQSRVPALPFPGEVVVTTAAGTTDTVEDPGVWARFKAAMGDVVTVRKRAGDEVPVSLGDEDYVRQGLWLQLESARLALLREDDEAFRAALDRARSTTATWFDDDAVSVERFLADLERLQATSLVVDFPDISEPWTRLQGIRTVRERAPEPAASEPPELSPVSEPPELSPARDDEPSLAEPADPPADDTAADTAPPPIEADEDDPAREPETDGGAGGA